MAGAIPLQAGTCPSRQLTTELRARLFPSGPLPGTLAPTSGRRDVGETTLVGYLTQSPPPVRDDMRIIDYIREIADNRKVRFGGPCNLGGWPAAAAQSAGLLCSCFCCAVGKRCCAPSLCGSAPYPHAVIHSPRPIRPMRVEARARHLPTSLFTPVHHKLARTAHQLCYRSWHLTRRKRHCRSSCCT